MAHRVKRRRSGRQEKGEGIGKSKERQEVEGVLILSSEEEEDIYS